MIQTTEMPAVQFRQKGTLILGGFLRTQRHKTREATGRTEVTLDQLQSAKMPSAAGVTRTPPRPHLLS